MLYFLKLIIQLGTLLEFRIFQKTQKRIAKKNL